MRSHRSLVLRGALAHYLRINPQACDTASGIAQWWMPVDLEVDGWEMRALLEELRDLGLVERVSTLDGRELYRRGGHDAASDLALDALIRDSTKLH